MFVMFAIDTAMSYITAAFGTTPVQPPCSACLPTSTTRVQHLICLLPYLYRELGFTPVEVNASDTRNKADASALKGVGAKLANSIKELSTNTAIGLGADDKPKRVIP